jgi:hypothetical protein
VARWLARDPISLSGEHEAAGEDERGSETRGCADPGVAPVESAVVDPDDERLRLVSGRRRRGCPGELDWEQGCDDGDGGGDVWPAGWRGDRAHAGMLRRGGKKPWWLDLNRGKTGAAVPRLAVLRSSAVEKRA